MNEPALAPVLTVDDVAALLRCKPDTVRAACRSGELPGLKWGEDWTIPAGALYRRLEEKALEEAAKRRAPGAPAATTATLHELAGKSRRKAAVLPVLPVLPGLGVKA